MRAYHRTPSEGISMQHLPIRRLGLLLSLAAVLLTGCVSTGVTESPSSSAGLDTSAPSASMPSSSDATVTLAPDALPTAAPTDSGSVQPPTVMPTTATPTTVNQPTDTPTTTAAPTPTSAHPSWPSGALTTKQAKDHIGENATVCGTVQATNWVFAEPGHPTWLNMDSAYPSVKFNAVIWGEQRRAWPLSGKPEVVYLGKEICVTGMIQQYLNHYAQIQDLSKDTITVVQ